MNDLITYLCNYAFDHGIGYELDSKTFKPSDSSFSNKEASMVFINMNWPNKNEIPFQLAHEISHIINGDCGSNNYSAGSVYSKEEYNANKKAIHILLDYCTLNNLHYENYIDFMTAFGIPTKLTYVVNEIFKNR
ncbi:ImmA/IrrE family metallo-endopeptidase [Pediococcus pentosaceus]|uniref:ImmA/IrrE family metallo-endopeptidase n=1 Tax=Pediococcus pentosaceus TaxID=1255 RepID=A0ABD7X9K4_PEDPE|nr:ImmA/IrrE family metallo-endopeptidase [Pediococcus pentosaceus]WEA58311.1 ImmA/IrrE family metallo-endopeptidase [Pediococcus pentosaceus]